MISLVQLQSICTTSQGRGRCGVFHPLLNEHMPAFGINTPVRVAAFIAQVMHESAEFRYVRELGSNAYLAKYDIGRLAKRLGNTPEADGDGQKFRGRGLIQITGRANYWAVTNAFGADFISQPELLEKPEFAVSTACWWWAKHHCNELADTGEFYQITRIINGGLNGLEDRLAYFSRARRALGCDVKTVREA